MEIHISDLKVVLFVTFGETKYDLFVSLFHKILHAVCESPGFVFANSEIRDESEG